MTRWNDGRRGRRAAGVVGALAAQLVFAGLLVWGLAVRDGPIAADDPLEAVTTVDLPPPADPPAQPDPAGASRAAPAPAGLEGDALPVEAPSPAVTLAATPAAPVAGDGAETSAGAGTAGIGAGAGGTGSGDGDGGIATPARRIAGTLRDSDYPRSAARQGLTGTVAIAFRVRIDGLVDRCTVLRSSGHAMLDELTCRLFTERYRFRPATNAAGQPVESTLRTTFTWSTRRR